MNWIELYFKLMIIAMILSFVFAMLMILITILTKEQFENMEYKVGDSNE